MLAYCIQRQDRFWYDSNHKHLHLFNLKVLRLNAKKPLFLKIKVVHGYDPLQMMFHTQTTAVQEEIET